MVRHTLKVLQQMLEDFKSVSDHFGTLCIKGLKQRRFYYSQPYYSQRLLVQEQQRQPQKNM